MHLIRVGRTWSPQAGTVTHSDTPETFHVGSERCSKDGLLLLYHRTSSKEGEMPPAHSLWDCKVVGMEGLAPGWVEREDLLMVLLSLCS